MANTFDFTKVDKRRYDISCATGALDFQLMVEEFMEAVKSSPGRFHGRDLVVRTFCDMIAEDSAWQLARTVVPEFRLSQDYNTDEGTLMNAILRALRHKRPRAPHNNATTTAEKTILRKRFRAAIDYLETCGRGVAHGSDQEVEAADNVFQKLMNALED